MDRPPQSYEEAYLTELSIVRGEVKDHLRHLGRWAKRKRMSTPIKMFPSRSYIVSEPLGNTLIIAPWNYPVQLLPPPQSLGCGGSAVIVIGAYLATFTYTPRG